MVNVSVPFTQRAIYLCEVEPAPGDLASETPTTDSHRFVQLRLSKSLLANTVVDHTPSDFTFKSGHLFVRLIARRRLGLERVPNLLWVRQLFITYADESLAPDIPPAAVVIAEVEGEQ